MPRNIENDALREKLRRERMLESGLRLFSKYGIENNRYATIVGTE